MSASEIGAPRHQTAERLFHWLMAVAILVCVFTAFLPIVGVDFEWVDIHWIAGFVLTASIVFHLWRVFMVLGLSDMALHRRDLTDLKGISDPAFEPIPGRKYDLGQELYHWGIAVVVLATVVSGILMTLKLDTPMWDRDPGLFSGQAWGLIYAGHGLAALALIFMFLLHLYFSLLPEHRDLLRAMIRSKYVSMDKRHS